MNPPHTPALRPGATGVSEVGGWDAGYPTGGGW
jgi:hypothetical protein